MISTIAWIVLDGCLECNSRTASLARSSVRNYVLLRHCFVYETFVLRNSSLCKVRLTASRPMMMRAVGSLLVASASSSKLKFGMTRRVERKRLRLMACEPWLQRAWSSIEITGAPALPPLADAFQSPAGLCLLLVDHGMRLHSQGGYRRGSHRSDRSTD